MIPLSEAALGALARLSTRDDFIAPDDFVLAGRFGDRISGSALYRRYTAARDAAGLPALRLHDLRTTFGSQLAASGVDAVTIKTLLRHSNLAMTDKYMRAQPLDAMRARVTAAQTPKGRNAP